MFQVFVSLLLPLPLPEPFSEPLPVPLGLPCLGVLCVSTSTDLCQVSLFATSLASRIFVPTVLSLMCLASTTLASCT